MYRSDYQGPQPPERIVNLITKCGGVNMFGKPNFRLVHGEFRRTPSAGTWVEWNDQLTTSERNEGANRPIRRVVETRWVLLYPLAKDKWILEKWCDPSAYGTPKGWYLPISSGGTMLYIPAERKSVATLGEYPRFGEYENLGYAFPGDALTEAVMLTAIGRAVRAVDNMPSTPEGRVLRRCFQAMQAEELKQRTYKEYAKNVLDETDFAFNGNPFVGAGLKRAHSSNKLLKKLGIRGHHIS